MHQWDRHSRSQEICSKPLNDSAGLSSPEAQLVNADVAKFVGVDRMQPFFVDEVEVV